MYITENLGYCKIIRGASPFIGCEGTVIKEDREGPAKTYLVCINSGSSTGAVLWLLESSIEFLDT